MKKKQHHLKNFISQAVKKNEDKKKLKVNEYLEILLGEHDIAISCSFWVLFNFPLLSIFFLLRSADVETITSYLT